MKIIEAKDYKDMSERVCDILITQINGSTKPVLGLATGSTPEELYKLLVNAYKDDVVSFSNVTTFNLDEYVGLSGDHPNSYRYYMNEKLFDHINIKKEKTHVPNGKATDLNKECERYEEMIQKVGGVDLQILGLGLNGHIGFNEPGTSFYTNTHVEELDESTRKANARFFDNIEEVPTKAITMGINSIFNSKKIILMVSGAKKANALKRLLEGDISEEFPASILKNHSNVTIVADKAALSACETSTKYY